MIISKTVTVRWGAGNIKRLIAKGYIFTHMGDQIPIKVEDISPSAQAMIDFQCDRCQKPFTLSNKRFMYLKKTGRFENHICKRCRTSDSRSDLEDITGRRFGRLVVVRKIRSNTWECVCDCGEMTISCASLLRFGEKKSCGCYRKELLIESSIRNKKHGLSDHSLYNIWRTFNSRCYNPNQDGYENYGGKGIQVCKEWHDFETFASWCLKNGYEKNLILKRLDPNGDFSPSNCKFMTVVESSYYRVNTLWIHYKGNRITLRQLSEQTGIPLRVLQNRYNKGWRGERLYSPVSNHVGYRVKEQQNHITINGITKTIADFARESGLTYNGLYLRIKKGVPEHLLLAKPRGKGKVLK
ncbi:hypothetical protein ACFVS2_20250 [Brevibacillus sp. NPDC058079]|uniref:hypothetical protein n=1 Tax=Brevibacillus sp. NPDC058079 TaxID=3346330 RepID=UPI0036E5E4B1